MGFRKRDGKALLSGMVLCTRTLLTFSWKEGCNQQGRKESNRSRDVCHGG